MVGGMTTPATLPMGEQSRREYHSGDPEPWEEICKVCGDEIGETNLADASMDSRTGERIHAHCDGA